MNKEIEKLEIKVSYLEEENAELNEIVIDMNKRLSVLMAQFEEMKKKVKDFLGKSLEIPMISSVIITGIGKQLKNGIGKIPIVRNLAQKILKDL